MGWYYGFKPYVPVAQRRAKAASYAAKLAKKEKRQLAPIQIDGRAIAGSFWGRAWCDNLESYSDFSNRLPRGRTYVRNGSVIDLQMEKGKVRAIVSGSEIYQVQIGIKTLSRPLWTKIKFDCGQSIFSLIDLLQGRFDQAIMQRLCQQAGGLFPQPSEIDMECSCPDWAGMCKHIAAVLYGVGARLDAAPELLFTLRNVNHLELISQATRAANLESSLGASDTGSLAAGDLGEMFGIELERSSKPAVKQRKASRVTVKPPVPVETAAPKVRVASASAKVAAMSAKSKPAAKKSRQYARAK
jgi:uncharacterized Zn finger protein